MFLEIRKSQCDQRIACKENKGRRSSWRGAQMSDDTGLAGDWLYSKSKESPGKVYVRR